MLTKAHPSSLHYNIASRRHPLTQYGARNYHKNCLDVGIKKPHALCAWGQGGQSGEHNNVRLPPFALGERRHVNA